MANLETTLLELATGKHQYHVNVAKVATEELEKQPDNEYFLRQRAYHRGAYDAWSTVLAHLAEEEVS